MDTRTRGLEITSNYLMDLEKYGKLKLNLGFSTNQNKITKTRNAITAKGEIIPFESIAGRSTQGIIESASPKNKLTLGADWRIHNWDVTAQLRRYGEWSTVDSTRPAFDQNFSEQWVADLNIGFKPDILKGLRLDIGAYNLFNSFPDHAKNTSVGGVVKYSFNAPEGGNGTFLYSKLTYDF